MKQLSLLFIVVILAVACNGGDQDTDKTTHPTDAASVATPADGVPSPLDSRIISAANVNLLTQRLLLGRGSPTGATYSPDGQTLVVSTYGGVWRFDVNALVDDTVANVWDSATMEGLDTPPLDGTYLATSADGTMMAVAVAGDSSGRSAEANAYVPIGAGVQVVDVQTHAAIQTLVADDLLITSAAFSLDGHYLAAGNFRGQTRIWDLATGEVVQSFWGDEHTRVDAWHPDGSRLASGFSDGRIKLLDIGTGAELHVMEGHTRAVKCLAFSPDGMTLLSAALDGTLGLWDAETGSLINQWTDSANTDQYYLHCASFSPDGQQIVSASGGYDDAVRIWDAQAYAKVTELHSEMTGVTAAVMSADGSRIISGGQDGRVSVWDATTAILLNTLAGHSDTVNAVAISPDGTRIASGGAGEPAVLLWDAATGELLQRLEGHTKTINGLAFNPDGTRLVSASEDATVMVWDAPSGQPLMTLSGHSAGVNRVAFNADGTRLASASTDKTAMVWDVATGEPLQTMTGHVYGVRSVQFSPDSQSLVTTSYDHTVRMWDVASGQEQWMFDQTNNWVSDAVFSPDGTLIVAASSKLPILQATDGTLLLEFPTAIITPYTVNFSGDGTLIVAASGGGFIGVWGIPE